jgi:hypothetical protein
MNDWSDAERYASARTRMTQPDEERQLWLVIQHAYVGLPPDSAGPVVARREGVPEPVAPPHEDGGPSIWPPSAIECRCGRVFYDERWLDGLPSEVPEREAEHE